jgi:8-oxo-dGTP pyrophosphatase MutT (NUDIX family)
MSEPVATPSPAATVLLLRSTAQGIEVLLQRRLASLSFMGGMWVFPGGRHESSDRSAGVLARVRDADETLPTLRDVAGRALPREQTLGLYVTACRETFEECGILLATTPAGDPAFETRQRPSETWREAVAQSADAFVELLDAEDLYLDVGRLAYWSHWITPVAEKRRFDTRFFAIAVPAHLEVGQPDRESTEQLWFRPADAAAAMQSGELAAAPPTIFTLEQLSDSEHFGNDVAALLAAQRGHAVPPIRPVLVRTPGGLEVRMPWDAEYDPGTAEPLARPASYPEHFTRRQSRMRLNPTLTVRAT